MASELLGVPALGDRAQTREIGLHNPAARHERPDASHRIGDECIDAGKGIGQRGGLSSTNRSSFWFGMQMTASATAFNSCNAKLACCWRRTPRIGTVSPPHLKRGFAVARDASNDRRRARSRATSQAGNHEHEVCVFSERGNGGRVFLGGAATFQITPRAQATAAPGADQQALLDRRLRERRSIRVDDGKGNAREISRARCATAAQPAPPTSKTLIRNSRVDVASRLIVSINLKA